MDDILTLRSFTCSSTSLSLSNPVSYDVGIARMKASQIDHVPPGLASFTLTCPPWRPSVHLRQPRVEFCTSPCGLQRSAQGLPISSTTRRKLMDTIRREHSKCTRASYAPSGCVLPKK